MPIMHTAADVWKSFLNFLTEIKISAEKLYYTVHATGALDWALLRKNMLQKDHKV